MWVALCPSDKNNGGIYYYNGSHKNGILPHVASLAKGTSQMVKDLKKLKNLKNYSCFENWRYPNTSYACCSWK